MAEVVDVLLRQGADPRVRGKQGETALSLAEARGLSVSVRRLRQAQAKFGKAVVSKEKG